MPPAPSSTSKAAAPNCKASLAFVAAHRPGSLVAALQAFSQRGVNLTRLDSRPLRDRPFEYLFYVDFEIGDPEAAGEALTDLEAIAETNAALQELESLDDPRAVATALCTRAEAEFWARSARSALCRPRRRADDPRCR